MMALRSIKAAGLAVSFTLTKDHIAQLNDLAEKTGATWEEVLVHALSEYRGLVGVEPPEGDSWSLDAPNND